MSARLPVAVAALLVTGAATAQELDRDHWLRMHALAERELLAIGRKLARLRVTGAEPVRQFASDKTERWQSVTQEEIGSGVQPMERKPVHRIEVSVDYDGDGRMDVARLANGPTEGVVLVTFGDRRRPPKVAYRERRLFRAGEEIYPAGRHRLLFSRPEVHMTLLLMQRGRPTALRMGE